MQDLKKLMVWQKAHALTLAVYKAAQVFPLEERYGLTSQLRRSAASIPANITEGSGRSGGPDMARFLDIAMGPTSEVEYHLLLAHDLGCLEHDLYTQLNTQVQEVRRMLYALTKRVRAN